MDVRHIVVLSQLLTVETLATSGRAHDDDFDGLEVSFLAKLLLHLLDILCKS